MKKLILTIALVLVGFTAFSQTATTTKTEATTKTVQENYTEVKTEEVPAAVTTALGTAYPGAVVSKAYVNEKKEYKLEIAVGEQKTTVYADANGNWIKK